MKSGAYMKTDKIDESKIAAITEEKLFNYLELSVITGVPKGTLCNMMTRGLFKKGKDYIKIGNAVRFKESFVKRVLNHGLDA